YSAMLAATQVGHSDAGSRVAWKADTRAGAHTAAPAAARVAALTSAPVTAPDPARIADAVRRHGSGANR
ncbi:MAG TPA: hypothetical protein VFN79_15450, partial [Steroidobacteraceae bacterium]|nr:hypothetical protein [Steroidobacteraceae bacterium]